MVIVGSKWKWKFHSFAVGADFITLCGGDRETETELNATSNRTVEEYITTTWCNKFNQVILFSKLFSKLNK